MRRAGSTLGFVAALVLACSVRVSPVHADGSLPSGPSGPSGPSAAGAVRPLEAELVCEDVNTCPENVGWLIRTTAIETTRCTVFLVADDTLVTARHCVEPTRHDGGRSLEARLTVLFAATAEHASEVHEARLFRLATAAPLSVQSASDWAVLRLETHTSRRALAVERSGVDDAMDVSLHVVEARDAMHGVLRALRCRTVIGSIFAPHIDRPLTPTIAMAGCDVRAGHSGAPVLDSAGRVRAVVHARDLRAFPWREPLRWPEALAGSRQEEPSPIAYATSFACIDWGRPGPSPVSCSLVQWVERSRHPGDAAAVLAESLRQANDALATRAADEMAHTLRARDWREGWRVDVERHGPSIDIVPRARCLVDPLDARVAARRIHVVIGPSGRPETRTETAPVEGAPPCVVGFSVDDATIRSTLARP